MPRSLYYPKADRRSQLFVGRYPGSVITPNCGVLHTTETPSWPGYNGGAAAPTSTYHPGLRRWRQHFPFNRSARALVDRAGGAATNRGNTVQFELIGTCDKTYWNRWHRLYPTLVYWPDPPAHALRDLADHLAWLHDEWGIRLDTPARFLPYPSSYGSARGQRLTVAQWNRLYGWVGHQHVPENDHGDPGNLPIGRLLDLARGGTAAPVQPAPPPAPAEKGLLDIMTKHINTVQGDDQTVAANSVATLRTGKYQNFLKGPSYPTIVTATVEVRGLKDGDPLDLEITAQQGSKTIRESLSTMRGSAGSPNRLNAGQVTFTGATGKDFMNFVRVHNPNPYPVTVAYVRVRGWAQ
ncbi:hypothetical protein DT076_16530 [Desertihabitans brevis]|uniref:Uncharacterized protein n=1 Tax=Desertihabitans brevis TaxID=2268447 RepID=A0A367YQU3_9ACTN|nr:N-acetylmuramoyl-L-alanine amidase [Desertihabitans brevis]RCK68255.1 hypothetical protein DT076_16530 [Desertihabitans brevis]